ncbi:hypothetical protein DY000_02020622 [Brassica cretica]|uniref:Uncharacterized protein n=1 Tax=Brassica cretica TaxID=69181 RepID=A0ABQ7E9G3_BRACR|nr:hypothetical protein DY000_02020622 [Brassica cretica]
MLKVGGEAVEKFLVPREPSLWYSVQFTLTRAQDGRLGIYSPCQIRSGEQALLCDVQGFRKLMFSINFSAARILK